MLEPAVATRSDSIKSTLLRQLQKDGVNVWRLMKLNDTADQAVAKVSFDGTAADNVFKNLSTYLDILKSKKQHKERGCV